MKEKRTKGPERNGEKGSLRLLVSWPHPHTTCLYVAELGYCVFGGVPLPWFPPPVPAPPQLSLVTCSFYLAFLFCLLFLMSLRMGAGPLLLSPLCLSTSPLIPPPLAHLFGLPMHCHTAQKQLPSLRAISQPGAGIAQGRFLHPPFPFPAPDFFPGGDGLPPPLDMGGWRQRTTEKP